MLWEELTAKTFPKYVKKSSGVCILPVGVLEKHGNHLPVGTDMIFGQAVCKKAAEKEIAVVFPYYFLGQIAEARHSPGCISASHKLIMDAILEMCDEIHRNGFTKIIIYSSHGGNNYFIPFFLQEMPRLNRLYNVYTCFSGDMTKKQNQALCEFVKTDDLGFHAGVLETSAIMYLRPDLVDIKAQNPKESKNMGRLAEIREKEIFTGFNWYAQYPYHFAGDPSLSTPEFGKLVFDTTCENLENVIRAVKSDNMSEILIKECNSAGQKPV
jgi:creatinine amidohydrolase